jgi:hypothetical protein
MSRTVRVQTLMAAAAAQKQHALQTQTWLALVQRNSPAAALAVDCMLPGEHLVGCRSAAQPAKTHQQASGLKPAYMHPFSDHYLKAQRHDNVCRARMLQGIQHTSNTLNKVHEVLPCAAVQLLQKLSLSRTT